MPQSSLFSPEQLAAIQALVEQYYDGPVKGNHVWTVDRVQMTTPRFVTRIKNPLFKNITLRQLQDKLSHEARKRTTGARVRRAPTKGSIGALAAKELRRRLRTMSITQLASLISKERK